MEHGKSLALRIQAGVFRKVALSASKLSVSPRIKDRMQKTVTRAHVWAYKHDMFTEPGVPMLLLTVPGRKTGKLRTVTLNYLPDGDRQVLCGSYGGDDRYPQWFQNLMAAGKGTVQIGREIRKVQAILATPAERTKLWPRVLQNWPDYGKYQELTDRELPLVILTSD